MIREETFDGRTLRHRYDAVGNASEYANGEGQRTFLTYDLAGQLVKRELSDDTAEEFEYDELGDVVRVTWPLGEVRLDRDAVGRAVRESQILQDKEIFVESTLDREGERIGRKTSLGHAEAIERGPLGARKRTVLDGREIIEHETDVLGREVARALPGGGRIESAFDPLGRLERRRVLRPRVPDPVGPGEPGWVGPLLES